jgi:hypothetical protein
VFEFHSSSEEVTSPESFVNDINKGFLKTYYEMPQTPIPLFAQYLVDSKTNKKIIRFGHREQNLETSFRLTKAPRIQDFAHFDNVKQKISPYLRS